MFVKNNFQLILMLCVVLMSCSEIDDPVLNNKKVKMKTTKLSALDSGYKLNAFHWKIFIECWLNKYNNMSGQNVSLLGFMSENSAGIHQYHRALVENNLGLKIPESLDHFYEAYTTLNGKFISVADSESIGFYFPSELKLLIDFNSDVSNVDDEWAIESPDEKYYQYGIEQDTSTGRNSYLKGALVIGKYGGSSDELILLYPNSKTKDGEMEASILSYASEFRAPSFAEMMRQVSLMGAEDLLPPYSQEKVDLTCARYLPLENVWWE